MFNNLRVYEREIEKIFLGEETTNISRIALFTDPNGFIPQLIRSIRAISILLLLLIIPFQFAFKNKSTFEGDLIFIALISIDLLYAVRLIFQSFLLPYVDKLGNTITNPAHIFKNFIG